MGQANELKLEFEKFGINQDQEREDEIQETGEGEVIQEKPKEKRKGNQEYQEEKMYRNWINSLGLDGVKVNNLYEECKDGVLLCQVIDRLDELAIDWNKVKMDPR